MDQSDLWQALQQSGKMTYGWWYSGVVLPIAVLSGCAYVLVLYMLTRRDEAPLTLLRWLFPASVPFILVLPSYYASIALVDALRWIWIDPPQTLQEISIDTIGEIGRSLDGLATMGLIGATLAAVLSIASLLRLSHGPLGLQAIRSLSQTVTGIITKAITITRTIPPRPSGKAVGQWKYGKITVQCGDHQGSSFGVTHGALIGKKEATMTITDPFVSSRHARFEIRDDQPFIADAPSRNGTYIMRNGQCITVTTSPVLLQDKDQIFLGDPMASEAIELLFERS